MCYGDPDRLRSTGRTASDSEETETPTAGEESGSGGIVEIPAPTLGRVYALIAFFRVGGSRADPQ
jgi:hypothetical protein